MTHPDDTTSGSEAFPLWDRLPLSWEAVFPPSREFIELHERFKNTGGVYVITGNGLPFYVGQTRLFRMRVSASVARHSICRHSGQLTLSDRLDWYPAENARERIALEARLIADLRPLRNIVRPKPDRPVVVPECFSAILRPNKGSLLLTKKEERP